MGVVAVFAGSAASHRQLRDKEINGVIDHADGSITTEKIRDGAITADKLATLDHITLAPRTTDPALAAGRVWFRSDLGLLSFSPDGTTVARVPKGAIDVDSHASRHNADGADPITGWIAPSMIGPKSDTVAYVYFRTRNIAGTSSVGHYFAPLDDSWGSLGSGFKRWFHTYTYGLRVASEAYIYSLRFDPATHYFPITSGVHATLRPYSDGYSYIGTDTYRLYYIRGVNVVAGDLVFGFEDRICPVCGREFEVGDAVVLKVYKKREDGSFAVVPVHRDCNPHPFNEELLRQHEEALKPREDPRQGQLEELRYKMPNPHAEFEIIAEEVIDDEHVLLRARFEDGIEVAPIVKIDATWEEAVEAIREFYLREKTRLIEEHKEKLVGEAKIRRRGSWVGRRGIVELK